MCPTETTNKDTRMRGSTRIDAWQRKKTDIKLYRKISGLVRWLEKYLVRSLLKAIEQGEQYG